MPINFGSVVTRVMKKIEKAGAKAEHNMGLSDHASKWSMNFYVAVDRKVHDAENTTISGTFLSRVYEGNFNETGKWCKDFEAFAKSQSCQVRRWLMWYTTCPKCAKVYGKNYVVILGQVA
jgi:hypothetical protein